MLAPSHNRATVTMRQLPGMCPLYLPPKADELHIVPAKADELHIVPACPLSAMCGRLRVGKAFFHVCRLVGAAMCSAFVRFT
jgi:hypothetical protein